MRTIIIILTCILSVTVKAQQGVITETISVKGNCEECKERIENASDIKGVKICVWNEDTKIATITYDSAKTDLLKIKKAIAASGHDAGEITGNAKAYNRLPDCCKYRDGVCNDKK
jgi:periplasmic mercuric ion binding protein